MDVVSWRYDPIAEFLTWIVDSSFLEKDGGSGRIPVRQKGPTQIPQCPFVLHRESHLSARLHFPLGQTERIVPESFSSLTFSIRNAK